MPDQLLPDQEFPLQLLPDQKFLDQLLPDQEFPLQLLPDQEFPDQLLPDQEFPDQLLPDQEFPFQTPPDHELPAASSKAIWAASNDPPKMSCSPESVTPFCCEVNVAAGKLEQSCAGRIDVKLHEARRVAASGPS